MSTHKTSMVVAFALACVLTTWLFFSLGRGPGDRESAKSPAEPNRERFRNAVPSLERMNEAAEVQFGLRGGASFKEIEKSFAEAVSNSRVEIGAEVLALAAELRADEFPEAAEMVASLDEPGRKQLLQVVLARWALFEPSKAAEFVLALPGEHDVREGLANVMQSWGHKDPKGGLRWFNDLRESGRYEPRVGVANAVGHLFYSWAKDDPQAAGAAAEKYAIEGGGTTPWVGIGGLATSEEFRAQALNAADSVGDAQMRIKALGWVIGRWSGVDPHAAAAWLDDQGNLDQKLQWAVSERYGRRDPRGNAEWLLARTPEDLRERALSTALTYWAASNVVDAAAWVEEKGPTAASIPIIARGYATVDLAKAMDWARRAEASNRDSVIAETLAMARMHDLQVDFAPYLGAGSVPAEEMQQKVDAALKVLERRF